MQQQQDIIRPIALDEPEAAMYLDVSRSYLRKARMTGTGPAFCRLGRAIKYRLVDLEEHLLRNRVVPGERVVLASSRSECVES